MGLYPCGVKTVPDGEVPPADPVTIVRQPVMTIAYPDGCYGDAELTVDQLPLMNREPETIPDIPGAFTNYLEYNDMGVTPNNATATPWVGRGAGQWFIYVDGVVLGDYGLHFDGEVGPFTVGINGFNWSLPHTFWLKSTYYDRPSYYEHYMGTGDGVVAYEPSTNPICPSIGTILWNNLGYWDPWVGAHHDVGDVLGPKDRYGNYLGLTGPWGSAVNKQHLASDGSCDTCTTLGIPNGSAFAATLTDFVLQVSYPEQVYDVESAHQALPFCVPTRAGAPVFRNRHKAEAL